MAKRYLILNEAGGWLENTVIWSGNTKDWKPPAGSIARLESSVSISSLPIHPDILNDPVEIIVDIEEAGPY
jgi:hypothetical protein